MTPSRLSAVIIDCQTENLEGAMAFWRDAMNLEAVRENDRYFQLRGGGLEVLVQKVEWPSSYHLDIEADDVDAEADRLETLGATKKYKIKSWWVMRAPTGHDFCVVPRG